MEHFRIFDPDAPEPVVHAPLSLFERLEADGSYIAHKTGIGIVWLEDNEAQMITVHIAEKRRYGTVDDMEELAYENLSGAFAV